MLPDTTPILPLEVAPDQTPGRTVGEFAGPDQLTRDALRDTTGPAVDFDYARAAPAPVDLNPQPIPPFDALALVKDQPWISVGVAALAGLGAGLVLFYRPKKDKPAGAHPQPMMGQPPAAAKEEHGPSLFDSIVSGIGAELLHAGKQVVEELSGALKEKAHDAMESVKGLVGQAEPPAV